jgi:hypothetical protein
MRNARIAEWILALVTTEDRAAATVGDLMEVAHGRGVVWFWAGVLGTALSIAWRDVRTEPKKMAWLALFGFVFQFVGGSIVVGLMSFVWSLPFPRRIDVVYQVVNTLVLPSLTIWWLASRYARGREVAFCFAMAAFETTLGISLTGLHLFGVTHLLLFNWPLWAPSLLPLFAGAILARHRRAHA